MFAEKPCHTIAASFYANFVHPFLNRNFTPREGARIQTFPDWYVFKGKPTVVSHKLLQREGREAEKHLCQYNQIGNAVPTYLGKAIGEKFLPLLQTAVDDAIAPTPRWEHLLEVASARLRKAACNKRGRNATPDLFGQLA